MRIFSLILKRVEFPRQRHGGITLLMSGATW